MKDNKDKPIFTMTLRSRQKKENEKTIKEKNNENKNNKKVKNIKNKKIGRNKKVKKEESDYESESENYSNGIESDYEYSKENNDDSDSSFETENSRKRKRVKKENININIKKLKKDEELYKFNRNAFSKETPQTVIEIREKLIQGIIPEKKKLLMSYFKTGPGDYAEGDQFFGIPVPGVRSVLKFCKNLDFENLFWLMTSSYHEERMLGAQYMTELSKKLIKEEEKKKRKNNKNTQSYHFILDSINDSLNKYKCHTIPDLIHCLITKKGWKPGERQGWDVLDIEASIKRQEQKFKRLGESRPIFLNNASNNNDNNNKKCKYQYCSNIGITDPIKIQKQILFEYYIECMPWIDNWDLVDLTCRDIIGDFLTELDYEEIKNILYCWLTYNINDQLAGYSRLKIKKDGKNNGIKNTFLNSLEDDTSLTTIWTKRVAIICTFYFINKSDFRYTIYIMEKLLDFNDETIHGPIIPQNLNNNNNNNKKFHDLIEKASGWMLREIGKRDTSCSGKGCKCILKDSNETNNKKNNNSSIFNLYANEKKTLIHFLNKYAWKMPRTMLRYSIEKLPTSSKSTYLNATKPLE